MKNIKELTDIEDSGWEIVKEWLDKCDNEYEVLAKNEASAKNELYMSQHTIHSILGSIVYETGGILIDKGWLRILGSGHSEKLPRGIGTWNKGKTFKTHAMEAPFILIADDVLGGFFAINGGEWDVDLGHIYYLAPDRIMWEQLHLTYTQFIQYCLFGDLEEFYGDLRWEDWEKDMEKIRGDQAFSCMPPIWSEDVIVMEELDKRPIYIDEIYALRIDILEQKLLNDNNQGR